MSIQNKKDFAWVYQCYLTWIQSNARPDAQPETQEALLGFSLCHEDVFENQFILLNQMLFAVPLAPSQSLNGQWELFLFSELNLMRKSTPHKEADVVDICPVEYMVL